MRAAKLLTLLLLTAAIPVVWAQRFPDARYKVSVRLSGATQPLRGAQELAVLLANTSDRNSVYDLPPPVLRRHSTYQLLVTITDPSGNTQPYTNSHLLRYETFGCLTVSSLGTMTVTPIVGALCVGPDTPELWVVLTDTGGHPIAMNMYLFTVSEQK